MHSVEETLFYRTIGLALGEAHWDLAADPQQPLQPLPVTDIDLHVTGSRGSLPDAFSSLSRLVRRIVQSGRNRPTPVEQDYLTGYARQLLQTPTSEFFLDPLALKAALDCPYPNQHAVQENRRSVQRIHRT